MEHHKNKSLENIIEVVDGITYIEEWMDITGYKGLYMVSNFGRIKSTKRVVRFSKHTRVVSEKILSQDIYSNGYLRVFLHNKNNEKRFLVHRLVAIEFIPNPNNKPQINHINAVPRYNMVENLEWTTQSENIKHAYKLGNIKKRTPWKDKLGVNNPFSIAIVMLDSCGNKINEFDGIQDAARKTGLWPSQICRVCKGHDNKVMGYVFQYKEDYDKKQNIKR